MSFAIVVDILKIFGALGLFIYGMKIMSEGIQKAAGDKLRSGLATMTNTRAGGVLTGFFTTSVIQSSSATTVMVVSFVNAGLLNLKQAIGVIMGANIGTTMTALIIVIFGFKFKITAFALPVLAIAVPMMFAKKERIKFLGEFLIGFSVLFIGLGELKNLVPDDLPENIQNFISALGEYGFLSTILMVIVGTLLTILVQSSSAAIAITLTLCQKGLIPFEMAAAIVLGENIGTTITANIAAVVGNTAAKRAARAHLIFNLMGVLWMLILFNPFLRFIDYVVIELGLGSPFSNVSSIKDALTAFHMSFNVINTLLLVGFVGVIAKVVTRMVPQKEEDEGFKLKYIHDGLIRTPAAAIEEAKREIELYAKSVSQMSRAAASLLLNGQNVSKSQLISELQDFEDTADQYEAEIANYVVKISGDDLSDQGSEDIRKILNINTALERSADEFTSIAKHYQRMQEKSIALNGDQRAKLETLFELVEKALAQTCDNLSAPYAEANIGKSNAIEGDINSLVRVMRKANLEAMETNAYDVQAGIIYRDIFNALENIGDHLLEINENITGVYAEEDSL